jgi:hypothetical protein
VIKLLTLLLSLLDRVFTDFGNAKLRAQGRQDVQEQLDANVAKAEAAMDVDDPARLDRLRDRFDRARR